MVAKLKLSLLSQILSNFLNFLIFVSETELKSGVNIVELKLFEHHF